MLQVLWMRSNTRHVLSRQPAAGVAGVGPLRHLFSGLSCCVGSALTLSLDSASGASGDAGEAVANDGSGVGVGCAG